MIKHYPYNELGGNDLGWLQAKHHFSFADYQNPKRRNFGALRVVNDDIIKAGAGFDMHPHEDMEIITYVRTGAITHTDTRGNTGRTEAGNVQVMSAGTGIYHSEYNLESEDTTLYQIWIYPRAKGLEPKWGSKTFPKTAIKDNQSLPLLVSDEDNRNNEQSSSLHIYQDAAIYGGVVKSGSTIQQRIKHQAYILISEGKVEIDGTVLSKGDAAEITDTNDIIIQSVETSEILVIDVPKTTRN